MVLKNLFTGQQWRSPPTAGKFVVVGGGIAGVTCAEQVRRERKRFRLSETLERWRSRLPPAPFP